MTPTDALRECSLAGRAGQFEVSRHAMERMRERGATRHDIARALVTAKTAITEGQAKWKLTGGVDLDGDPLALVVALVGRTVIVTLF